MKTKQSQYRKTVTISKLEKLKKTLPTGWRNTLPQLAGVGIATIDNFFRGQKVKLSTAQLILDAIEALVQIQCPEISEIENKITKLIGNDK